MQTGTFLLILADLITLMKTKGLITADGAVVVDFGNVSGDVTLATDIEGILTAHGVVVPTKVDKVIKLLPLLLDLAS